MATKATKRPTRPIHLVFAVFLLGIFGVLCWQIYVVVTTPPDIAPPPISAGGGMQQETDKPAEQPKPDANTEEVQALKKLVLVEPADLGGDANHVYFRDSSGLTFCEINKSLADISKNEWLDSYLKDGKIPAGAGVLCNQVRSASPHESDIQKCDNGNPYSGGVAAVWGDGVGYGICKPNRQITVVNDSFYPIEGNQTKAMNSAKVLNIGHAVRVGDYICGIPMDKMLCVNALTGSGFDIGATEYKTFGGSNE